MGARSGAARLGARMGDDRVGMYAELLVSRCIDPSPGWQVLVTGTAGARPLLEALSASLAQRGAFAIRRISFDEPLGIDGGWIAAAPPELAARLPPLEQEMVDRVDAKIFVLAPSSEHPFAGMSPAVTRAVEEHIASIRPQQRVLSMPNVMCCFPTAALAALAGLDLDSFTSILYDACLRDWSSATDFMRRLAARLDRAEEVTVSGAGTDLSFSIAGRKALVDDGRVNMPGGEVFLSPHEESAYGVIEFAEFPQMTPTGAVIGARLEFDRGVVTHSTADQGAAILAARLERDEGARRIGEFGIGCNPGIPRPLAHRLFDEKIAGTMHIALGQGFPQSGGTNTSVIHWDLVKDLRPGGEIALDGEVIQRDGRWLI